MFLKFVKYKKSSLQQECCCKEDFISVNNPNLLHYSSAIASTGHTSFAS